MTHRPKSTQAFTLVELIAAVALLAIMLAIMAVVFRSASTTITIGQDRVETYRTVRAIFRLLERDITSAFLIADGPAAEGFTGEGAVTPAFLENGWPDSDRLTLIVRRPSIKVDPLTNEPEEPGFMEVRYSRFTYARGEELAGGCRHYFFRAVDENDGWRVGDPLPLTFTTADPDPTDSTSDNFYRNCIAAVDLTDLQFEYLRLSPATGEPAWEDRWDQSTWTQDPDGSGPLAPRQSLPLQVRVSIRLPRGKDYTESRDPDDHQVFTHVVHLAAAP